MELWMKHDILIVVTIVLMYIHYMWKFNKLKQKLGIK